MFLLPKNGSAKAIPPEPKLLPKLLLIPLMGERTCEFRKADFRTLLILQDRHSSR
jgi:hypothetical protein